MLVLLLAILSLVPWLHLHLHDDTSTSTSTRWRWWQWHVHSSTTMRWCKWPVPHQHNNNNEVTQMQPVPQWHDGDNTNYHPRGQHQHQHTWQWQWHDNDPSTNTNTSTCTITHMMMMTSHCITPCMHIVHTISWVANSIEKLSRHLECIELLGTGPGHSKNKVGKMRNETPIESSLKVLDKRTSFAGHSKTQILSLSLSPHVLCFLVYTYTVNIGCLCTSWCSVWHTFAVITSAVSFPGWSGDLWLLYYTVFLCLLCLYT